ncbi:MAG: MBL fold metallo-hydrolase, partial [Lachnospiraceae bacterium]|nr:MBL fold metallo-hydrolase [Lachnospiraceae bacterium]
YYLPEESVLFSGDTLFRCSVGRTDFPTGSMGDMHRSLHEKLFALPDGTEVFPGHDSATTIHYEKQFNPY